MPFGNLPQGPTDTSYFLCVEKGCNTLATTGTLDGELTLKKVIHTSLSVCETVHTSLSVCEILFLPICLFFCLFFCLYFLKS